MSTEKLRLKDLVTLGIFVVIYFVLMFVVGTPLGFTVIGYLFYPIIYAIIGGIVTMFYMAKVQKKWAVFLFYFLPGAIMTIMGHTVVVIIHTLIIALIAEFVHRGKGLSSVRSNILTHAVASLWTVGPFWQIYLMSDRYYAMTVSMMGEAYAKELLALPKWILPVLYLSAFVGGLLGGKLGAKILRKHFEKAGMTA